MANESYIHGKKDDAHHEGKYSELKRLAESEDEIVSFWRTVWFELYDAVMGKQEDEERPIDKKDKVV